MTAMERIEEIAADLSKNPELSDEYEVFVERSKPKFLLRAFKVMLGTALMLEAKLRGERCEDVLDCMCGQIGEDFVRERFEKRMAEGESV